MKKIIDDRGKLFGVINVIDLIVLIVVILAAAALIWKIAGNRISNAVTGRAEIEYVVKCSDMDSELVPAVENAEYPARLTASGSYVDGYLKSFRYESGKEAGTVDMYFTITANVPGNTITYPVGSQEVRVGKEHIVKTSFIEITGIIISMELSEK
ncbi:MAG: DUF4330 domain-containing protein [Oscillospiraceae bacterium]|nr:DUF4330 domain-containing protein [Oscillospiraceae bacterium]